MAVDQRQKTWQAMLKRRLPAPVVEPARGVLRALRGVVVRLHVRRLPRARPGSTSFYCVYRERNAGHVAALVEQARASNWAVHLWALDTAVLGLAPWTVGTGEGGKFEICNRLLVSHPPAADDFIVICDDDLRFRSGDPAMLLAVIRDAGLDMAQPAHDLGSHFSHGINVRRPGALARLTDFVEIGPLIAIGPGIRNRVIPFDEQRPMGWGLELQWSALAGEGFRLGVVDAVAVEHIDPVGEGYDSAEARRKLNAELRRRGLHDVSDVARDRGTWWAGTRAAPWLRPGGRA